MWLELGVPLVFRRSTLRKQHSVSGTQKKTQSHMGERASELLPTPPYINRKKLDHQISTESTTEAGPGEIEIYHKALCVGTGDGKIQTMILGAITRTNR